MTTIARYFAVAALLLTSGVVYAQTEPTQQQPPASTTAQNPPAQTPPVLSDAAAASYDRRESLPNVNVYLPEGQASVRLRKLIRNVLFESQIDYEFVNGDISTFLRYKYYARNYTYRLGVFDSIQFDDIGSKDNKGFDRVRGGLLLLGIPKDYDNRYFVLLQDDALTFGDADNPDNRKNNLYTKIGYQFGTQFDERMNAIVGESRGRITPVLTAFRDVGPQRTGLAAAITQSGRVLSADYQYTKLEAEGLRRTDLTQTSFLFTRLHAGAFLARSDAERDLDNDGVIDDPSNFPLVERYSIPKYELFRLGGRDALKSIKADDEAVGTQELHLTNELFVPVFRNRDYRTGVMHWNTLYGVAYAGAGTVGFNWNELAKTGHIAYDVGLGTEAALTVRDFDVYLSVLVARTLEAPGDAGGTKVRFSIHTVH
ncbi:MAG TPA: hypothetical protein VFN10_12295 [Thermoanaerobaculia bacterium]|nr:hypothetical protein [Thermoanaerobaculia bacterium]